MSSLKAKKIDENHLNMEYLPIRIQVKLKSDIEHSLENQPQNCTASENAFSGGKPNLKSYSSFKQKKSGILSIAKDVQRSQSPQSDYSDDSSKVVVKKSSPIHIKGTCTLTDTIWITQAEEMLKRESSQQNIHEIYEKLLHISATESYVENWNMLNEFRKTLKETATKIFEKDWKFYCEHNLELFFWKTLFYNILQFLKFKQKNIEDNDVQNLKKRSLQIVQDGVNFYKSFISIVEQKFKFKTEFLFNKNQQKVSSFVKVLVQKIYLNLGDLHRYQAQLESNNFIEAKKYYTQAQKLIPENGVPYNQLAIIALTFNNYFEAVYYHVRSLTASNPIMSAKESLRILLDEIRKKYESKFQNIASRTQILNSNNKTENSVKNFRKEIWIHPNGTRRLRFQLDSFTDSPKKQNENRLSRAEELTDFKNSTEPISNKEQKKEFISNYLYVVSKIYIGVDMEIFENAMFQMLYQFSKVINEYPCALNRVQLLEIIAINIFLYEYSKTKKGNQELSITDQQVQNCAYTVGLLMFGVIINKANDILKQFSLKLNERGQLNLDFSETSDIYYENYKTAKLNDVTDVSSKKSYVDLSSCSNNYLEHELKLIDMLPVEFVELLQSTKIWCNWLNLNLDLCKSPNCYCQKITPWKNFANLLTSLARIFKNLAGSIFSQKLLEIPRLEEDLYLLGFGPLKAMFLKAACGSKTFNDQYSPVVYRMHEIFEFALNSLCSKEISILKVEHTSDGFLVFTKNLKEFDVNQDSSPMENSCSDKSNFKSDDNENSKIVWKEKVINVLECSEGSQENISEYKELKSKKIILEKSNKAQELYKEKLRNVLEDVGNLTIMEVRPKYLVPDTNCFIDFLNELEYLVTRHSSYILMVPLVVINELEGLMKGFKIDSAREITCKNTNSRIHHFDEVARISELSLNFIKNNNRLNIRCCTTRGSILKNSSAFSYEESDDNTNSNDDKILTSALSITTDSYIKKSEKTYLCTEVVLLTTDRNLRVKALAKNLAVSDLKEFLNWIEERETSFD